MGRAESGELVPLVRQRRTVLDRLGPLEPLQLALLEARGCVLAEDVSADVDLPSFANSGMDGYAVVRDDATAGAELVVVGEVAAGGANLPQVGPGRAVRIMTGAPIPPGGETIVPVEATDESGNRVRITTDPGEKTHIRPPGESVRAGQQVLTRGRRLGAGDIAMLAALGRTQVVVHPRPRVVIISTGDELVDPGAPLGPGQLPDSNSFMLTAQVRDADATAYRHAIVRDDRRALTEAFEGALVHGDLLLTSGGVSAGRYDLVKQVLADLGDVEFVKVGMQPGMPQAFGFLGSGTNQVPCFGLPGNPVSAFVSFEVFVRPALRRLQGRSDLSRPRITATLDEPANSPPAKISFLRVGLRRADDGWHATLTGSQGSGVLSSVVAADGLAEVPAEVTDVAAGSRVVVHLLVDPV